MFRRINNNKFGVIEYAIDSEEDLLDLPREDTNNTVYAILRKDGKKLVYLYSKEIKDYILINGDLEEINVKIENINEQLDTIETKRLTTITPLMFGAKGDGIADDTQKIQDCINYAIQNNCQISSPKNKTYKISSSLIINGECDIELNGSKILATTTSPLLVFDHRGTNKYNGKISNIVLDCNFISEKGIEIIFSQRRIFTNISIINVFKYGIYVNRDSGNVNKFSYCYMTTDSDVCTNTTGIWCDNYDQVFSHIDMVNIRVCIQQGYGNAFYNEVHGYISNVTKMWEGSCFFKGTGTANVILTNCYPDTQQYHYYLSNTVRLNVIGNLGYNNKEQTTESFMQGKKGYIFYFENNNSNYSKRVTISDSAFIGVTYNSNFYYDVTNLESSFMKINSGTQLLDFANTESCSRTQLIKAQSLPLENVLKNKIKLAQETYTLEFEFKYNPSVSGKLSNLGGFKLGDLPSSCFNLPSSDTTFSFPVEYGKFVDGKYYTLGYIRGEIKNNPIVKVFSDLNMYTNNLELCNAADNTDYVIKVNVVLPLYNY